MTVILKIVKVANLTMPSRTKGNPCLNLAVVCQLQENLSGGTVYLHLSKVVRDGILMFAGSDLQGCGCQVECLGLLVTWPVAFPSGGCEMKNILRLEA